MKNFKIYFNRNQFEKNVSDEQRDLNQHIFSISSALKQGTKYVFEIRNCPVQGKKKLDIFCLSLDDGGLRKIIGSFRNCYLEEEEPQIIDNGEVYEYITTKPLIFSVNNDFKNLSLINTIIQNTYGINNKFTVQIILEALDDDEYSSLKQERDLILWENDVNRVRRHTLKVPIISTICKLWEAVLPEVRDPKHITQSEKDRFMALSSNLNTPFFEKDTLRKTKVFKTVFRVYVENSEDITVFDNFFNIFNSNFQKINKEIIDKKFFNLRIFNTKNYHKNVNDLHLTLRTRERLNRKEKTYQNAVLLSDYAIAKSILPNPLFDFTSMQVVDSINALSYSIFTDLPPIFRQNSPLDIELGKMQNENIYIKYTANNELGHMNLTGKTGSGKSFTALLVLIDTIQKSLKNSSICSNLFLVDPNASLAQMLEKELGTFIQSNNYENKINIRYIDIPKKDTNFRINLLEGAWSGDIDKDLKNYNPRNLGLSCYEAIKSLHKESGFGARNECILSSLCILFATNNYKRFLLNKDGNNRPMLTIIDLFDAIIKPQIRDQLIYEIRNNENDSQQLIEEMPDDLLEALNQGVKETKKDIDNSIVDNKINSNNNLIINIIQTIFSALDQGKNSEENFMSSMNKIVKPMLLLEHILEYNKDKELFDFAKYVKSERGEVLLFNSGKTENVAVSQIFQILFWKLLEIQFPSFPLDTTSEFHELGYGKGNRRNIFACDEVGDIFAGKDADSSVFTSFDIILSQIRKFSSSSVFLMYQFLSQARYLSDCLMANMRYFLVMNQSPKDADTLKLFFNPEITNAMIKLPPQKMFVLDTLGGHVVGEVSVKKVTLSP